MIAPLALGFDFDRTLGVDNGLERRALMAYARELGATLDPADPATVDALSRLLDDFRAGVTTRAEMLAAFGAAFGLVPVPLSGRWEAICSALVPELVRPLPGARELCAMLRARGVPFAVLTNGWTPLQQQKIAYALGAATVRDILVSDALGAVKPDPRAFDALVAVLGVPRADVWYVGDNARGDIGGARAAGLRAVWLAAPDATYPADLPPPTVRIAALRELETLVQNALAP